MSHTVAINVQFKARNEEELKRAFRVLGWEVNENGRIREYAGQSSKAYRWVATNPDKAHNAYDIGVEVAGEELRLMTDTWGGSVQRQLGNNFDKLRQEYAAQIVESEYGAVGTIQRSVDNHGNLVMEVQLF